MCNRSHHVFLYLCFLRLYSSAAQNLLSRHVNHHAVKGSAMERSPAQYRPSQYFSQHVWHHQTAGPYLLDPPALWVWSIWTPSSESCNNKAFLCLTYTPSRDIYPAFAKRGENRRESEMWCKDPIQGFNSIYLVRLVYARRSYLIST